MRKSVGGSLAAMLFCLPLSTGVWAQTDKEAAEVAASLAICKDSETEVQVKEQQYEPCEQYIDANIEGNADTIKWMLEQIESQQNYAGRVSNDYYHRDEILQMVIIILSLLTTVSAAITKLYPKFNIGGIDFALAPIVLSALIAAVTSINAYYQFDEYRRLSQNMADDLAELEIDIHFMVLRHATGEPEEQVDQDAIDQWHERLKTILQRYSQRETGNGV
jgi:hypothetical protein